MNTSSRRRWKLPRLQYSLLTLLLILAAWAGVFTAIAWFRERSEARSDDQIRAAVFRHLIGRDRRAGGSGIAVYFLSANGNLQDPPQKVLGQFAGLRPAVKPVSQASVSPRGVQDKRTGEKGMVLYATTIRWIGRDTVEVEGGYFVDGLWGERSIYRLQWRHGVWEVEHVSGVPHADDVAARLATWWLGGCGRIHPLDELSLDSERPRQNRARLEPRPAHP